jgi:signal transduction histidine kinase
VAVGWVACVGLLGLAVAAVSEPAESGCVDCPANLLLVHGDASATQDLGRLALMLIAAWAAGLLLVAAVRLARLRPAQRRRAAPVLAPAALAIALLGTQAAHGVDRGFLSNDGTDRLLFTAQIVALALTAAGVAWERERARRARAAVADLVIELGSSAGTTLRDRLAVRLRDPSLRVLYARDDGAGWLDASGAPADAPDGQTTPVVAGDRPLAVLAHRPGLLDDPVLAREVADGSRLALEHERLRALRAAQLAQLQDSRVRIVAAADAERLRLERALHDGAQQSLVALAIGVRLARGQDPVVDAELETVAQEVWTAVAELRAIAHGLFPSALVEEGLDAALEVLSEQQPRLVYRAGSEERFAAPAESAAYFVVTEALQLTEGEVTVGVTSDDGVVRLDVLLMQDPSGPLTALEDRVGAAGGTVHATGRRLSVELPCAS